MLAGRPKEIELIKTEDALGLTLTDNGAGYVFIKRIKENSIMDRLRVVQIGDHIEKLNGMSLVGKRHYEVARMLKEITRGATLVLRLVEPLSRSGFGIIGPRCAGPRSRGKFCSYGNGRETLRFKADGMAKIEQVVSLHCPYITQRSYRIHEKEKYTRSSNSSFTVVTRTNG
jgi:hypothetical protein